MDLDFLKSRQPDFFKKIKINNLKAFMTLNLVMGLHTVSKLNNETNSW